MTLCGWRGYKPSINKQPSVVRLAGETRLPVPCAMLLHACAPLQDPTEVENQRRLEQDPMSMHILQTFYKRYSRGINRHWVERLCHSWVVFFHGNRPTFIDYYYYYYYYWLKAYIYSPVNRTESPQSFTFIDIVFIERLNSIYPVGTFQWRITWSRQ